MARIRSQLEDFVVEELPLYRPEGIGEHTWLEVEKRGVGTEEVARALARAAGVDPRQVGYAGRKDRLAIARQWFSVPSLAPERASELEIPGVQVLGAVRHSHRVGLGDLQGNRFRLYVREVTPEQAATARLRLPEVLRRGMTNRFGDQRFGRDGANVGDALELLKSPAPRRGDRRARLLLSALQAAVFNEVLRLRPVAVDELLPGDLAEARATGALLLIRDPAAHRGELEAFELSATGPLPGEKMRSPRGEALELEREAAARVGVEGTDAVSRLRRYGLIGGRRPVRVEVSKLVASWEEGACQLTFELPPGSYATVLIEEIFGVAGESSVS